jgi:hypothetical protein
MARGISFRIETGDARTQSLSGRMEAISIMKNRLELSPCKMANRLWEQHTDDPQTKVKVVLSGGSRISLLAYNNGIGASGRKPSVLRRNAGACNRQ